MKIKAIGFILPAAVSAIASVRSLHADRATSIPIERVVTTELGVIPAGRVTTGRQVPFCLFTDPEFARIGLSEKEAKAKGVPYRLFKDPMDAVLRARTLSETRGFMKAIVEADGDRILGFTAFGVGAGEIMTSVRIAMNAGVPFTALRDSILTHPTLAEGPIPLFSSVGTMPRPTGEDGRDGVKQQFVSG